MYSLKREFFITLQNLLLDKPAGFSEYQLINHFKDAQHPFFVSANLSDSLSLFRSHFVLFHLLYKLRDNLRAAGEFELHISPLQIYLAPMSSATQHSANSSALAAREPLRRYYLDLNNLQDTRRAEVDALLNSSRDLLLLPQKALDALHVLGIEQPLHCLSAAQLRSHYRQLVSQHHPDRGGCTERLQRINQAMDTLRTLRLLS